jgi:hypothetical protein
MPTFRAYLLNTQGNIVWGDWIEAADESEARDKAHKLCRDGLPVVELWQGARHLAEIPCAE